jgi:hypothetical protein
VLYRPLYRGEVVWNRSRKRDTWGQVRQQDRPESEWLRHSAPELRVVEDSLWQAAHTRLAESRAVYLRGTKGQVWGHPARGTESKYHPHSGSSRSGFNGGSPPVPRSVTLEGPRVTPARATLSRSGASRP